jgi:mannose-6-phosphate isomerase-like protein (cupin superfamily)
MKAILSVMMSFAVVTLFGMSQGFAQDKSKDAKAAPAAKAEKGQSTVKVLLENDKVRAQEVTYKPGDENKAVSRYNRVVRALTAGTLQRTWAGGKTDKVEFKVGDVIFNPAVDGSAAHYTAKNIGKSELRLYVVQLK